MFTTKKLHFNIGNERVKAQNPPYCQRDTWTEDLYIKTVTHDTSTKLPFDEMTDINTNLVKISDATVAMIF